MVYFVTVYIKSQAPSTYKKDKLAPACALQIQRNFNWPYMEALSFRSLGAQFHASRGSVPSGGERQKKKEKKWRLLSMLTLHL